MHDANFTLSRYLRYKYIRVGAVQLRWVHATDSLQSDVIDKVC